MRRIDADADRQGLSRTEYLRREISRLGHRGPRSATRSAQPGAGWRQEMDEPPVANLPVENLTPRMEGRAVEVRGLLAERGYHCAAKIPDLLIAAAAELPGLTVLDVDKDFDLIADLTLQPVERLRGGF